MYILDLFSLRICLKNRVSPQHNGTKDQPVPCQVLKEIYYNIGENQITYAQVKLRKSLVFKSDNIMGQNIKSIHT